MIQGAPSPPGYTRFRQSNEFYYLCGIESPHAYLAPRRHEEEGLALPAAPQRRARVGRGQAALGRGRRRGQEALGRRRAVSGDRSCSPSISAQVSRRASRRSRSTRRYQPAEGMSMSRDLAMRSSPTSRRIRSTAARRGKASSSELLRQRFPVFESQGPLADARRAAADQEPARARRDPQGDAASGLALVEACARRGRGSTSASSTPSAKFIYYRNGAQGDAYYSLIGSGRTPTGRTTTPASGRCRTATSC